MLFIKKLLIAAKGTDILTSLKKSNSETIVVIGEKNCDKIKIMFSLHKKLSENLIIFTLTSFIFISIWGIGVGMEMKDEQMSSCPFTAGQTAICQMNITEHIAQWRETFLGIPAKSDFLALVVLLFAGAFIPFAKQFSQLKKITALTAWVLAYHRANFAKVFNPLLIAFSDGILNPKIYEPARV